VRNSINNTSNSIYFPWQPILLSLSLWISSANATEYLSPNTDDDEEIEIIVGEDRVIYEYRQNGVLTMIKVVPRKGRPYYMVPADGAPHYESLDHKHKLYPQWVIVEW